MVQFLVNSWITYDLFVQYLSFPVSLRYQHLIVILTENHCCQGHHHHYCQDHFIIIKLISLCLSL